MLTQKLNIKYPFKNEDQENYFVDLNDDYREKVRSEMLFAIFTSKNSRIRKPDFGSDLLKFIFDPDDSTSLEAVKTECKEVVGRWVKNCQINDIQVVKTEDDIHQIFVKIAYSVKEGNAWYTSDVVVEL